MILFGEKFFLLIYVKYLLSGWRVFRERAVAENDVGGKNADVEGEGEQQKEGAEAASDRC